ncbi:MULTISPECIES: S10 family serine carboxypeptidase-like protein [Paraburkholderia]|uniref:Carboxypeptidase C (Cathepsin A) n=1 Tax=Paraburkholderia youngii TaxID=2782701 RepID=A0A7W8LFG6_9BURK|nr:peptidase [Paraburkholderia youngii]MBB5406042.1 carboxypeptidase C (cathepsin A) [Paraburkholderia youngii]
MTGRIAIWPAIAALAAVTLVACGGDDPTPTQATPSAPVTSPPNTGVAESEQNTFLKIAPTDKVLNDVNVYDTTKDGSISLSKIDEDSSVKRHTIAINGKALPYIARAGHLVAYRQSETGTKAEAAIFYTAYTRDALPKENRPVTFLWNGGPGSASIWLHLGSWGPKRLRSDAPNMTNSTEQPDSFPFEDNAISLLDQSDIVFVDPPGTGLSTAIAPLKNGDLWGTDDDAQVVADFITSYTNKYNRQSSPKYLYGESYGGIRTPIVANLLEQAGTSSYVPDPSGKPAKVLAGFILNSPLVDYNSNCDMMNGRETCEGYIPSYAMTADYFKKSVKRGTQTQEQYLDELRTLAKATFQTTFNTYFDANGKANSQWNAYAASTAGQALLNRIADYTGIPASTWKSSFNYTPEPFRGALVSGYTLGRYDARMKVPTGNSFAADDYINMAFLNQLKTYFPDFVNYKTQSSYEPLNSATVINWKWKRTGSKYYYPQSITDIQAVLTANPDAKLLILHGYEDIATPGFQTELDLEGVNLSDRIPVKWFEGGHMIYNTEIARLPLKQAIDSYYQSPARVADGSLL